MKKITILAPAYNEADNLPLLAEAINYLYFNKLGGG